LLWVSLNNAPVQYSTVAAQNKKRLYDRRHVRMMEGRAECGREARIKEQQATREDGLLILLSDDQRKRGSFRTTERKANRYLLPKRCYCYIRRKGQHETCCDVDPAQRCEAGASISTTDDPPPVSREGREGRPPSHSPKDFTYQGSVRRWLYSNTVK
jgi:hypothetical protein